MFYKTISYLKFLLKSTNQHGVHSPFVFDFVTKGLYKKGTKTLEFKEYSALKKLSKREQKILSRIVLFFKIDEISFDLKPSSINLDNNYKMLYMKSIDEIIDFNFNTLNSKQFVVIHGIHQQKESLIKWQEIIKNNDAKVTIDLFYFGLIFIRKEQAKEHFNIRV